MDREIRDKWVAALRSGKYKQGKHVLRTKDGNYCCLGVLKEIEPDLSNAPWDYAGVEPFDPDILSFYDQACLARKNDAGETFNPIADWIEENVPIADGD